MGGDEEVKDEKPQPEPIDPLTETDQERIERDRKLEEQWSQPPVDRDEKPKAKKLRGGTDG